MKGKMILVASAILIVSGSVQAQTPGQVPLFDQPGTGACNSAAGNDCVDSVITQDSSGNIGIGTSTPASKLHVAGGNISLDGSTPTAGNILKAGLPFLHNFGGSNTFLGSAAGNFTMTGAFNMGSGSAALRSNTTGLQNTASGAFALVSNTTGNNNTASGAFALQTNTAGGDNTASGVGALTRNTTGVNNTASGSGALISNTTGNNNTASGLNALGNNTTGDNNTALGIGALTANTTGFRNTAIGSNALSGSTGGGVDNTAIGVDALYLAVPGFNSFNTAVGSTALTIGGTRNTAIGYRATVSDGTITNATAIGNEATANASNKIRLGNNFVTVIEGQVPYTFPSDRNQKENFQPVDGEQVLRKISDLSLTSWNYIGHDPKQFRHYGPVAQEFFAAFGHDGVGTIGTDTTVNSGDMEGILMVAAQALEQRSVKQQNRVAEQEKQIAALRGENGDLKGRLEALERRMGNLAFTRAE